MAIAKVEVERFSLTTAKPFEAVIAYDKMESALLPYGSSAALVVARNLAAKITSLLQECAI